MQSKLYRTSKMLSASVAIAALFGCGSDPVGPREPEEVVFHPSLGVDLTQMTETGSGLYYEVLDQGTGPEIAEIGDSVTFEYRGWFHTGVLFADSDPEQGQHNPFNYVVGNSGPVQQQVITGIDEGITGMRLNETRLLVIPWQLGYGAAGDGRGVIPPYAVLVFRVEVTDIVKAP